jgi:putative membrane protein
MRFLIIFFISLVAFEHIYFMLLEMFFWTKPKGLKAFGLSKEHAQISKVLAANQGLYNGFLAAGLVWSILDKNYGDQIAIFFLSCVIIAGIYGAYSTKKIKLFYVQSLPAIIALVLLLFF